jgi:hypothetical protein
MQRIFPKGTQPDQIAKAVSVLVRDLSPEVSWEITIKAFKPRRSNQQCRYLFGVVYPWILEQGGEALRGYTKEDLHEYMLGDHFGWEVVEIFGKKKHRPLRRSSKLTKQEFTDFLQHIEVRCAELGIVIPEVQYG